MNEPLLSQKQHESKEKKRKKTWKKLKKKFKKIIQGVEIEKNADGKVC